MFGGANVHNNLIVSDFVEYLRQHFQRRRYRDCYYDDVAFCNRRLHRVGTLVDESHAECIFLVYRAFVVAVDFVGKFAFAQVQRHATAQKSKAYD